MEFTPLKAPKLDPRNERTLAELALLRTYDASGKTLNDFSPSSPLRVFSEMMAFVAAELLFYVNQLPLAIAIQFLQIMGIQRRLGSYAKATLRFTLATNLSEAYIVPQGFAVLTTDKRRKFKTDAQLVIPAGATFGEIDATCTTLGTGGNVAIGEIDTPLQSLPYLDSIFNPQAASGGLDSETLKQVQVRAFREIRRRGLITATDYEEEIVKLLGAGSIAKVVGNVAQDGRSRFPGAVHAFVLNPGGATLNTAQIDSVRSALIPKSQVGIEVFVSNALPIELDVLVTARLLPGVNSAATATEINRRLTRFFAPGNRPLGRAVLVDDIRYQIRLAGVQYVEFVSIAEAGTGEGRTSNFPMPYRWAMPKLLKRTIALSDGTNDFRYQF